MTEAERIEKEATNYSESLERVLTTACICRKFGYIAGATAENERLQQLIKEKEAPTWYTENEMYHWLIREYYSETIAKELSGKYANYLQGSFKVGFEKGQRSKESEISNLEAELKSAQELNLELMEGIKKAFRKGTWLSMYEELESLINKAK